MTLTLKSFEIWRLAASMPGPVVRRRAASAILYMIGYMSSESRSTRLLQTTVTPKDLGLTRNQYIVESCSSSPAPTTPVASSE